MSKSPIGCKKRNWSNLLLCYRAAPIADLHCFNSDGKFVLSIERDVGVFGINELLNKELKCHSRNSNAVQRGRLHIHVRRPAGTVGTCNNLNVMDSAEDGKQWIVCVPIGRQI